MAYNSVPKLRGQKWAKKPSILGSFFDSNAVYHVKKNLNIKYKLRSKNVKCWTCGKPGHVPSKCIDNKKKNKDMKEKRKTEEMKKSDTGQKQMQK